MNVLVKCGDCLPSLVEIDFAKIAEMRPDLTPQGEEGLEDFLSAWVDNIYGEIDKRLSVFFIGGNKGVERFDTTESP